MNDNFSQKLYEIKTKYRELKKLKSELSDKEKRLKLEHEEFNQNKSILEKELNDVKKIEGLTISALFYTIIGKKEEKLEKEKKEYLLASLKYSRSKDEMILIKKRIDKILEKIKFFGDVETQYKILLKQKEKYLIKNNDKLSKELIEITENLSNTDSMLKELKEAKSAGILVLNNIDKIMSKLQSAENWGTLDILGGGLITDLAKHSKIDDAKILVHQTQYFISNFNDELKDVNMLSDIKDTVQIGSLSTFADFFFDGLIADFHMQSRIENSISNIASKRKNISSIMSKIKKDIEHKTEQRKNLVNRKIIIIENS